WQTRISCYLTPSIASIGRLEETTSRTTAREHPRGTISLPYCCEHGSRVVGIQRKVNCARTAVREENPLPGFSTVSRAEYAALFVRTKRMAERRHVNHFGIDRINSDACDCLCV